MYMDLHVKYQLFLSNLDETCNLSTYFRKIFKHQISWKSAYMESSCPCGRTTSCFWQFFERASSGIRFYAIHNWGTRSSSSKFCLLELQQWCLPIYPTPCPFDTISWQTPADTDTINCETPVQTAIISWKKPAETCIEFEPLRFWCT